jgi:hypothetical protein
MGGGEGEDQSMHTMYLAPGPVLPIPPSPPSPPSPLSLLLTNDVFTSSFSVANSSPPPFLPSLSSPYRGCLHIFTFPQDKTRHDIISKPQVLQMLYLYSFFLFLKGSFLGIFLFSDFIQHCFICCPSDSTVSEDAGFGPRTFTELALAVRVANH